MKTIFWWIKVFLITAVVVSAGVYVFDRVIMPDKVRLGEEYSVPNVKNMTFENAKTILEQHGFTIIKTKDKVDYSVPAGKIIEQNPKANSVCKLGRRIYVTISAGELPSVVPDLIGIAPKDAEYKIEKAKLTLDSVIYDFSDIYPEGVVMDQTIAVGDSVVNYTDISLIVSMGKHPFEFIVPDLVGLPKDKAVEAINKGGFTVGEIQYVVNDDYLPNTVIEQLPVKEEVVNKGHKINIWVVGDESMAN